MRTAECAAGLLMLAWSACAIADTFAGISDDMSVSRHGNVIVATNAPPRVAAAHARRISAYDSQIRERYFASLADRPVRLILIDDAFALEQPLPDSVAPSTASGGATFDEHRREQRIVVAETAHGDGAVIRELVRALLAADNPAAPRWFETAMASLYESSEWRDSALTPVLDGRMAEIPADEDLDYDVFAGICDCYPLTPRQTALMRLLVVHLHERGELVSLYRVIERSGAFVTLMESLDAMDFDREAWKSFAESSVRRFQETRATPP